MKIGLKVNINKTEVMLATEIRFMERRSFLSPCAMFRKGVGGKSIQRKMLTGCVHKKFGGIKGTLPYEGNI